MLINYINKINNKYMAKEEREREKREREREREREKEIWSAMSRDPIPSFSSLHFLSLSNSTKNIYNLSYKLNYVLNICNFQLYAKLCADLGRGRALHGTVFLTPALPLNLWPVRPLPQPACSSPPAPATACSSPARSRWIYDQSRPLPQPACSSPARSAEFMTSPAAPATCMFQSRPLPQTFSQRLWKIYTNIHSS